MSGGRGLSMSCGLDISDFRDAGGPLHGSILSVRTQQTLLNLNYDETQDITIISFP